MAMQTDVKALGLTEGEEVSGRWRIKGILIAYTATTGAIELTDGDGGTSVFAFAAPGVDGAVYIPVPGEGILCVSSIFAETVTDSTITVFYG